MKVISLAAENIKRIVSVEVVPDESVVQITGKNDQGKSSVLDSIFYALGGGKGLPKEPVRRGADHGSVKLDLGEFIVTRRFGTNGTTDVRVESAKGARHATPQRLLDDLLGSIAFDPLEFSRMKPKEQFDMLRQVSAIEVDFDALKGLNLRDFENRTDVNKRAATARAKLDGMTLRADIPDAPVDVDALLSRMTDAAELNATIERRRVGRETAKADLEAKRATLAGFADEEARQLAELKARYDRDVAECKSAFAADAAKLQDQINNLQERFDNAEPLPEPVDVAGLRQQVDAGRALNIEVARKRDADMLRENAEQLEDEAKALTLAIKARDQEIADAIKAAKLPVPDIGFGDKIVTYKGLPFDQASSAVKLRVSVAIAMAMNPKLRIMLIREGGLLDDEGMQILREMTAAADYQAWVETVHASGPVAVEMVDGRGVKPAKKEKAAQ